MAGFRKAKAEQAAIKMGLYGPAGSGKSLTSLLIAEGLAAISNTRVAYVDTERGTDFYCQAVPDRAIHPAAFDFDALYERSLTEVNKAIKSLKPEEHGVLVIDSITHLWEAARNAYTGKKGPNGQIPMHAWSVIKKPYKELMHFLLNCPQHVIICGRQGNDWGEDEEGELKNQGFKMRAEGETAYEPHLLLRLEVIKPEKRKGQPLSEVMHVAHVEKDRTGMLPKIIEWPTFANVARPLLGLLGKTQAKLAGDEETAAIDADALLKQEQAKIRESADLLREFRAKLDLCKTKKDAEEIGKQIDSAVKAKMLPNDLNALRTAYLEAVAKLPA